MTSPIKTDADLFFDETPSLWPAYLRAPFKKNTLRNGQDLPRLTGIWKNIQFDPAHVNRYRACCGLSEEPAIPWTYPYLFIARLQLRMLTHPAFPLTPLGALHCRNTIVCRETLDPQQTWTAETGFLPSRRVKQGLEICLKEVEKNPNDYRANWMAAMACREFGNETKKTGTHREQ